MYIYIHQYIPNVSIYKVLMCIELKCLLYNFMNKNTRHETENHISLFKQCLDIHRICCRVQFSVCVYKYIFTNLFLNYFPCTSILLVLTQISVYFIQHILLLNTRIMTYTLSRKPAVFGENDFTTEKIYFNYLSKRQFL